MLKFIFGLPCSGKTHTVLETIKKLTEQQKETVLIVPEQSSFESEKAVLRTVGDNFSLSVNVLSFSRLLDEIQRVIGGGCAKILTDSDKIIFMHRALLQVASDLNLWGKYAHSINFAKTMLDTVGEFKINAVSVNDIKNASKISQSATLKAKLEDISLIYETYDLLTAERFIDPADNLTKLYQNLEKYRFFEGKTVFLDGFKGFTGQQFKIIDRILAQAKDVYISLTNDISSNRDYDVFTNIRTAVSRIENIAKLHNVEVENPIVLDKPYYKNSSLSNLERLISGNEITSEIDNNSITVCKASTTFDEAEFAARTIRKLIRQENYRFSDFVIIARDTERYKEAVDYACKKNDINCFFDDKLPLASFPLCVATDYAIKALNFSTENILRFHKSGVSNLSLDEVSKLENYTYLWNIDGKIWLDNWNMDVRGFVTDEVTEKEVAELEAINTIRLKAIEPLLTFKQNFKNSAKNMSKAIIELLDSCNAKESLKSMCKRFENESNIFSSDALKQSYDAFLRILDSLVECFGDKTLNTEEFYEALALAISLESVGIIPQTLDQAVFGAADRIRPSRPKVAIILGANQGVFPKFAENSGVFATNERKKLIELGIEIADNSVYTSIDEDYLVYCNLCCPTEKLYICYSVNSLKGEATEPSAFVDSVCQKLSPYIVYEPSENFENHNLPETRSSAFSEFCRRTQNPEQSLTLKTALGNDYKISNLLEILEQKEKSILKENAKKLYGNDINMSATKFDTFNRCKFSFFCKYGLKTKKLQPADFDVLQRGTIVHYVLEKIISTYKEEIKNLENNELDKLCDDYINEYLDSVSGFKSVITSKHKFLISKISRSLKEVVFHLAQEFKQSDFKPVACELKIGGNDGLPLSFPYNDGNIKINGSIDRVDEYNGYIRIVDYKTGSKSFKLPDILFGLNLQMLIYLYAVIRANKKSDDKAAGIFYMPSKRDLNGDGMAMNGLIKADKDLVFAMEKENIGEFIPKLSVNKDGSISKTATSYITQEEFTKIFDYIENLMQKTGDSISKGDIAVNPIDGRESGACDYCDYKSVCGFENRETFKVPNLKNSEVFEMMEKGENNGI